MSWKAEHPYKPQDTFNAKLDGSCHCGRVAFQLSRDQPLTAKFCHCHSNCQVLHGAPFQWAAIVHKNDLRFTKGLDELEWYDSSAKSQERNLPCKAYCKFCHTPLFDEGRNMLLLFPTLLHFDSDEARQKFYPECHLFYGQTVVEIPDGKTKWEGLDEKSQKIE